MIKISRPLFMLLCQLVLLVVVALYPAATVIAHGTIHIVQPDETLSMIAVRYARGCINMTNDDAQWLFDWAGPPMESGGWLISSDENPGTLVIVHQ